MATGTIKNTYAKKAHGLEYTTTIYQNASYEFDVTKTPASFCVIYSGAGADKTRGAVFAYINKNGSLSYSAITPNNAESFLSISYDTATHKVTITNVATSGVYIGLAVLPLMGF